MIEKFLEISKEIIKNIYGNKEEDLAKIKILLNIENIFDSELINLCNIENRELDRDLTQKRHQTVDEIRTVLSQKFKLMNSDQKEELIKELDKNNNFIKNWIKTE